MAHIKSEEMLGGTSQVALVVKNPPVNAGDETEGMLVQSLGREDPWRRKLQPTPVFLPGEPLGQRSLACYSPWGCKELNMTKVTVCASRSVVSNSS